MSKNNILAIILLTIGLYACKKEIKTSVVDARISFYELTDNKKNTGLRVTSKAYTFAVFSDNLVEDTIGVRVRLIGEISPKDRTFYAESVPGLTTAIKDVHYKILPGILHANEYIGNLKVVVYRTIDLKKNTVRLGLKLSNMGDFKTGVVEERDFELSWTDGLIKPANWDLINVYFGTYSEVKYKFIISVLNRSNFPTVTTTYQEGLLTNLQMLDYKNQVKDALNAYNKANAVPLTDEFKVVVSFP